MPLVNRLAIVSMFMLLFSAISDAETDCAFIGETSIKDILWTDLAGVKTNGNNLLKTGPEGWNSAAFSSGYISDDGAFEVTVKGTSASRMLGFAYVNTDVRFEGINYAVFLTSYGRLYIFENGVQRGNYTTYNDDDVIRIERKKGVISYLKNDSEIYVSKIPSSGGLYADVSLYSEGASIDNARLFGVGSATVSAEWVDMAGVGIEKDMLVKKGGTGWNSGAASIQNIVGDGAVEITVQDNDDTIVAGLSGNNEDAGYNMIDYAIFISTNGSFYVYEDGFNKGSFGDYDKMDVFRIERQGTRVTYMRNCEPFYVSKRPSRGKLILDVSLYSKGAKITNATIYGASL